MQKLNLQFWDRTTVLYPHGGAKRTPQDVYEMYGWAENPAIKVVISVTNGIWGAIFNFEDLKQLYNIEETDDNLALQMIEDIMNTPPEPVDPPIIGGGGLYDEFIEGMLEGLGVEII